MLRALPNLIILLSGFGALITVMIAADHLLARIMPDEDDRSVADWHRQRDALAGRTDERTRP